MPKSTGGVQYSLPYGTLVGTPFGERRDMLDKHEKRRRAVIKALRPLHHDDEPNPEHDDEALEALRREVEIDDQDELD